MTEQIRELTYIRFDSKSARKGMKQSRIKRKHKPKKQSPKETAHAKRRRQRRPLKKVGPRTRAWKIVWNWLRRRMIAAGRTKCEFYFIEHECGGPIDPCHSKKRNEMIGDDIYAVARG